MLILFLFLLSAIRWNCLTVAACCRVDVLVAPWQQQQFKVDEPIVIDMLLKNTPDLKVKVFEVPSSHALTTSSRALPSSSYTLPSSSYALTTSSRALTTSSRALTTSSRALTTGSYVLHTSLEVNTDSHHRCLYAPHSSLTPLLCFS